MNTALMESIQLKANVMASINAHMVTDILTNTVQETFSSMAKSVIGQKMLIVKTKNQSQNLNQKNQHQKNPHQRFQVTTITNTASGSVTGNVNSTVVAVGDVGKSVKMHQNQNQSVKMENKKLT